MVELPRVSRRPVLLEAPRGISGDVVVGPYRLLANALDSLGLGFLRIASATVQSGEAVNRGAEAATSAINQASAGAASAIARGAEATVAAAAKQAQALNQFGEAVSDVSTVLGEDMGRRYGERMGEAAVVTDADGRPRVELMPVFTGRAGVAYNRAASHAYLAKAEPAIKAKTFEKRFEYAQDPQGFADWAREYSKSLTENAGEFPPLKAAVEAMANDVTSETYRGLVVSKHKRDIETGFDSIRSRLTDADNELSALARQNGPEAEAYKKRLDNMKAIFEELVANPKWEFSAEKAARELATMTSRHEAEAIIGVVEQHYREKQDVGATLKHAEEVLWSPKLNLTPDQRHAYLSKAKAEIRGLEAQRGQDLSLARQAKSDAEFAVAHGVRMEAGAVDRIVEQLNAAGGHAESARFRATISRQEFMRPYGRLPLSEQNRELQVASVASRIGASPFEASLISREASGNPGAVNRLGYAGLYQFGAPRLADLGVYKPGSGEDLEAWSKTARDASGKWSGTFSIPGFPGVKNLADFRASPEAQKAAFDLHRTRMDQEISAAGLNRFEGQSIGGVAITRTGLYGMLHLGGVGSTRRALESGGRDVARDENNTSVLDYARQFGDGRASIGVGIDPRLFAGMQETTASAATAQWNTIAKGLDEGVRPTPAALTTVIEAATLTGNHALLETVGARLDRFDASVAAGRQPLAVQQGLASELRRVGATTGIEPGREAWVRDMDTVANDTAQRLKDRPVTLGIERFPEKFQPPVLLDVSDQRTFQAGLRERARIVGFVAQNYGTGPLPALESADLMAVQSAIEAADPTDKVRIFADIASALPEGIRTATLAKLGETGPQAMVQVFAGALSLQSPDVGVSVMRGLRAIQAEPRYDPTKNNRSGFNEAFDEALPVVTFGLVARTSEAGPLSTIRNAVVARYADLAAQAGDTSTAVNEARLNRSVIDVTGGVVRHNGGTLIAPRRGMQQWQFDAVMAGVADGDLSGATTLAGEPVTASYLRSGARLESVGDGRYLVQLGTNPQAPIYAVSGLGASFGGEPAPVRPFVLDLRGREAPVTRRPIAPDYREMRPYPRG